MQATLQEKERILKEKQEDLDRHKKFSEFLESVVNDKSGDKEGFNDIEDLQNRFKSLKNENKQLMQRVSYILFIDSKSRKQKSTKIWKKPEPPRKRS